MRRSGYGDGMDSDDSMADFIEEDEEGDGGGGGNGEIGGGGRPVRRPKRRARRNADEDNRLGRADDMFGEDERPEDDEPDALEDEEEQAPARGIDDMYEPAVIQEFFLSNKDVEIRSADIPERLHLDLAGRELVATLDDVRAEARWMVKSTLHLLALLAQKYKY